MRAVLVALVFYTAVVAATQTQMTLRAPSGIVYVVEGVNTDYPAQDGVEYYNARVVEESVPRFLELTGATVHRHGKKNAIKARRRARAAGAGDWTETGTVLGQGGFGRVTEARQSGTYSLGAPNGALRVALKKQYYGYSLGENHHGAIDTRNRPALATVQAEVAHQRDFLAAGCSVPTVYDEWNVQLVAAVVLAPVAPAKGEHYLVMEKLASVPVYANLDALTPAQRFKRWGLQLVTAIRCLHTADYIHRDLKYDNIMVTTDLATLKVVDFGLVRQISTGSYATLNGHGTSQIYADRAPYATAPLNNHIDQLEDYNVGITLIELTYGLKIHRMIESFSANRQGHVAHVSHVSGQAAIPAQPHVTGFPSIMSWTGSDGLHNAHISGSSTEPSHSTVSSVTAVASVASVDSDIDAQGGRSFPRYLHDIRAVIGDWLTQFCLRNGALTDVGAASKLVVHNLMTHATTLQQAATAIGLLP